ncbi:Protein of unknown function [Lysobacter sp. yr284]|uniref:DUF3658 domain-containing protein n=1 Tax=Lysobacter sp. yr284 TaxID=1761791 RepID=UPI000897AE9B|nr:DUF3658 domain-containing protein [Lysobacter sp. yr284]SDY65974.1 Protein of unknown function [Lysobacter sp. yr284]
MSGPQYEPADAAPDAAGLERIAALRPEQIQAIDAALMSACDRDWRKVAGVVGGAMGSVPGRVVGICDGYYAARVSGLVARGLLESRGDLSRMRYSEVRVASPGKSPFEAGDP